MRIPKPDFQRDLSYLEEEEVKVTEDNSSYLTPVLIVLGLYIIFKI